MERYLSNDLRVASAKLATFIMKTLTPGGRRERAGVDYQGIASIDELLKTVKDKDNVFRNTLKGSTTKEANEHRKRILHIYDPPQERFETMRRNLVEELLFFTTISVAFGLIVNDPRNTLMLEMLNVSLLIVASTNPVGIETSQFYLCRNASYMNYGVHADDFAARFGAAPYLASALYKLERPFVTGSEGFANRTWERATICKEMSKENIYMHLVTDILRLKVVKDVERMLNTKVNQPETNLIADAAANRMMQTEDPTVILHEVGHVYYYFRTLMRTVVWLTPKLLTSIDLTDLEVAAIEFDDKNAKLSGELSKVPSPLQGNTDLDVYSKFLKENELNGEPPKLDANNPIIADLQRKMVTVLPRNGSDLGVADVVFAGVSPAGYQSSGIAAWVFDNNGIKKKLASLAEVVRKFRDAGDLHITSLADAKAVASESIGFQEY
ncbi:putative phage virion structural protein [Salmonella phage SPFM7]|nr:putative phage virion structural protein [Salmonella phage SPFM7]